MLTAHLNLSKLEGLFIWLLSVNHWKHQVRPACTSNRNCATENFQLFVSKKMPVSCGVRR